MLDHDLCLKRDKQHNIDFPHRDDDHDDREVNQLIEPLEGQQEQNTLIIFYFSLSIFAQISLNLVYIIFKLQ